jgi:hypothetical protein
MKELNPSDGLYRLMYWVWPPLRSYGDDSASKEVLVRKAGHHKEREREFGNAYAGYIHRYSARPSLPHWGACTQIQAPYTSGI